MSGSHYPGNGSSSMQRSPSPALVHAKSSPSHGNWKAVAEKLLEEMIHAVSAHDVIRKAPTPKPFVHQEPMPFNSQLYISVNDRPRGLQPLQGILRSGGTIDSPAEFVKEVREVFLNYLRFYISRDPAVVGYRRIAYFFLDDFTRKAQDTTPPLLDPNQPRLDPRQKGICRRAIEKVLDIDQAETAFYFLADPDPSGELPDYKENILKKMYLSKIMTNLEQDRYESLQDMADDFHLMVQNSVDYGAIINLEPPDLVDRAKKCLKVFDSVLADYIAPYQVLDDELTPKERAEGKTGVRRDEQSASSQAAPSQPKIKIKSKFSSKGAAEPAEGKKKDGGGKTKDAGGNKLSSKKKSGSKGKGKRKKDDDDDDDDDEDEDEEMEEEEERVLVPKVKVKATSVKASVPIPAKGDDYDSDDDEEIEFISDDLRKNLLKAIDRLFMKKDSEIFKRPVNIKKYPSYPLVIKNPMDLTTLKERMDKDNKNGYIKRLDEFKATAKLIFDNSRTYNQGNAEILATTQKCEDFLFNEIELAIKKAKEARRRKSMSKTSPRLGAEDSGKNLVSPKANARPTSHSMAEAIPSATLAPPGIGKRSEEEIAPLRLKVDYGIKMYPELREKLVKAVKEAMRWTESAPFVDPVRWRGVPSLADYPSICPNPMDLGTLLRTLQGSNKYVTLGQFLDDLGLIWRNCRAFNLVEDPSYPIMTWASKAEKRINQLIEKQVAIAEATKRLDKPATAPASTTPSIPKVTLSLSAPKPATPSSAASRPLPAASGESARPSTAVGGTGETPPPKKAKTEPEKPPTVVTFKPPQQQQQPVAPPPAASVPPPRPSSSSNGEPSGGTLSLKIKMNVGGGPPVIIAKVPSANIIRPEMCRNLADGSFKPPSKSDFHLEKPHENQILSALHEFSKVKAASFTFGIPVLDRFAGDEVFLQSYRSQISHPMDLQTMFIKLSKGEYSDEQRGRDLCDADAQLMFSNAITYNSAVADKEMVEKAKHFRMFWSDVFCELVGEPKYTSDTSETKEMRAERRDRVVLPSKASYTNCLMVLKKLLSHPDRSPFMAPVKSTDTYLPDYRKIVKEPRDLGTISSTVQLDKYSTYEDFVRDVRLVFSNCLLYNPDTPENRPLRDKAMNMAKVFETEWRKMSLGIYEMLMRKELEERLRCEAEGIEYVPFSKQSKKREQKVEGASSMHELLGPEDDEELVVKKSRKRRKGDDDDEEDIMGEEEEEDDDEGFNRSSKSKRKREAKDGGAFVRPQGAGKRSGRSGGGISSTGRRVSMMDFGDASVSPGPSNTLSTQMASVEGGGAGGDENEESLLGQYERETEIQVQARQEAIRRHRMAQRKTLTEYRNLQKSTYLTLVQSMRGRSSDASQRLNRSPSQPILSSLQQQEKKKKETDGMDIVVEPSSAAEDGPISTQMVLSPRSVANTSRVVAAAQQRKNKKPASIFQSSKSNKDGVVENEVDLKPAPMSIQQQKSGVDIVKEMTLANKPTLPVKRSKILSLACEEDEEFERDLLGQFVVVRVFRRQFGKVAMYSLVVREAAMKETLTSEFPEGALVGKFSSDEKLEATFESMYPRYFELRTPFRGKEEDLANVISNSMNASNFAPLKKWMVIEDLNCIGTAPRIESRGLAECICIDFVVPSSVSVTFSLGGETINSVVEM